MSGGTDKAHASISPPLFTLSFLLETIGSYVHRSAPATPFRCLLALSSKHPLLFYSSTEAQLQYRATTYLPYLPKAHPQSVLLPYQLCISDFPPS